MANFRFLTKLIFILSLSVTAQSKELANRLGIGIKNNTSSSVDALAGVYYPNKDIGVTGGLGIDTQKDYSRMAFSAGIRKILFRETQMNFYYGGQLSVVNYETAGEKQNGFELSALYGAEFFLTGLDSLALTFEGGVSMVSVKDVRFKTIADHPLRAGIIFYF